MDEIACRWNTGKAIIRGHIRSGELPAQRLGHRTVRISEAALQAFEEQHGINAAQEGGE